MATKKSKTNGQSKPRKVESPAQPELITPDVVQIPLVPHYKQRRIEELTLALTIIRDALKSRFPEDPGAFIEVKPFKDGFTLNASGLDDDDAPVDCTAVTLANAIFSDRHLIRRTSNRDVKRTSNRGS